MEINGIILQPSRCRVMRNHHFKFIILWSNFVIHIDEKDFYKERADTVNNIEAKNFSALAFEPHKNAQIFGTNFFEFLRISTTISIRQRNIACNSMQYAVGDMDGKCFVSALLRALLKCLSHRHIETYLLWFATSRIVAENMRFLWTLKCRYILFFLNCNKKEQHWTWYSIDWNFLPSSSIFVSPKQKLSNLNSFPCLHEFSIVRVHVFDCKTWQQFKGFLCI